LPVRLAGSEEAFFQHVVNVLRVEYASSMLVIHRIEMAKQPTSSAAQSSLADVLFPADEGEVEEAILDIPPERRVLRTEHYDFSVATLMGMMEPKDGVRGVSIPDFQRRYVWSDRQASRLVESLIIQCPIPVIYLNQEKDETFSVIDGNQRLKSLKRFTSNEFALVGLTSYPELSGLKFAELDARIQRHISNRVLRCTVILKETHPQVKFDVFERLNSGAVALTRQELRHGLYFGALLQEATKVAESLKLAKLFGTRPDKRMKAEELVIRFWALHGRLSQYEKPLASFITDYVESNRSPSGAVLGALVESVLVAHQRATELFGDEAFRYSREDGSRFNAAVYDAHMLACAQLTPKQYEKALSRRAKIRLAYSALAESADYARIVTLATSDKAALLGRVQKVLTILKSSS
jgi:hypothetical protein